MQKTFAFLLLLMLVTFVAGESRSQSNQTQDEQNCEKSSLGQPSASSRMMYP
jgi:hypothetical protein